MQEKKDILGKLFFILSIIFIIYTLLTPLNHLICHIDEYFTLTVTNLPVTDIITVTAGDVHPPLYYLMAKVVVEISKIFNLNILFNLKLLSTLAFVLIMAISATEIRRQYGWLAAGLFALALSVMSEFSIYYLIARMYSWTVLFILIAFLAFKNIIDNKNDKKSWIILTLFSVFAAYTHYFGAITSVCIYLILLIYLIRNKKNEIKNWVLSTITGIVIYIPWVFVLLGQLMKIKQDYWIPPVTLESFFRFIGYYAYTENIMFYIVSIGFLITIILIYRWESDNFAKKDQIIIISAFVAYFGTIFIGIAVSDLFTPVIDERYMMPAAALIWLSISIILAKIKNKKLFIVVLALICLLLLSDRRLPDSQLMLCAPAGVPPDSSILPSTPRTFVAPVSDSRQAFLSSTRPHRLVVPLLLGGRLLGSVTLHS